MAEGAFDPRSAVILEKENNTDPPLELVSSGQGAGTAEVARYEAQQAVVEVEAERDSYLVFTDSYYPGWNAYMDGVKTNIYRADYLFRAVFVPQGRHTIQFRFEPFLVSTGGWISALAGLGIAALWLYPLVGRGRGLWQKGAGALVDLIRRFK